MNIIETIQTDFKQYIQDCIGSLNAEINILEIDDSKGETDFTSILFVEKKQLTRYEAIAILTLRLMMHHEQWTDYKSYTKEDIIRWTKLIALHYQNSMYFPNISHDEFMEDYLIMRLHDEQNTHQIKLNDAFINHREFKAFFPTKNEILKIAKTNFQRLEQEYYLETETHFILLNWYTTA